MPKPTRLSFPPRVLFPQKQSFFKYFLMVLISNNLSVFSFNVALADVLKSFALSSQKFLIFPKYFLQDSCLNCLGEDASTCT